MLHTQEAGLAAQPEQASPTAIDSRKARGQQLLHTSCVPSASAPGFTRDPMQPCRAHRPYASGVTIATRRQQDAPCASASSQLAASPSSSAACAVSSRTVDPCRARETLLREARRARQRSTLHGRARRGMLSTHRCMPSRDVLCRSNKKKYKGRPSKPACHTHSSCAAATPKTLAGPAQQMLYHVTTVRNPDARCCTCSHLTP